MSWVESSLLLLLSVSGEPDGELPAVRSWDEAVALAPVVELADSPQWIRHRVRHRERVSQIAARYGVPREKVVEWNELDPEDAYPPKRRRSLKVRTRRLAPPRVQVAYVPEAEESWGDVAAALRVEIPDLHAWNWQHRSIAAGRPLVAWVDPAMDWTYRPGQGPEVPETFDVAEGGLSVGRPHRGRLLDAVQLPESPLYDRGAPRLLWGSSYTIENLMRAFAHFRHDTGFEHPVVVGSISKRNGRRLPPHVSHQSGRYVDIRLPLLLHVPPTDSPNPDEVDWYATWALIKALGETEAVTVIFLEAELHRRVYEAARTMGERRDALADYLVFPQWRAKADPLVRHAKGHDEHIHVRFHCADDEPKCKG